MLRILFNSRSPVYKEPFGTLSPEQLCTLRVKIPIYCQTLVALCRLQREDGQTLRDVPLQKVESAPPYETWSCSFSLMNRVCTSTFSGSPPPRRPSPCCARGEQANMESGDRWQLSCVVDGAETPDWAKGAVIYQVFPDRFAKSGQCDLTGKLEPYTVHQQWTRRYPGSPPRRAWC